MNSHTLQQRADFYAGVFPNWPAPKADLDEAAVWRDGDRWLSGIWILGNDYRNSSTYYGAYP